MSEYAVTGKDAGTGSLLAALAEAAFLIGLEKNRSGIVIQELASMIVVNAEVSSGWSAKLHHFLPFVIFVCACACLQGGKVDKFEKNIFYIMRLTNFPLVFHNSYGSNLIFCTKDPFLCFNTDHENANALRSLFSPLQ